MQRFRTATPMGDWRSFKFTMTEDGPWTEGKIYKVQDTVGLLLLDIQYTAAGCKKAKTIVKGDEGVLVYHIEKVIVDKLAETGLLVYLVTICFGIQRFQVVEYHLLMVVQVGRR